MGAAGVFFGVTAFFLGVEAITALGIACFGRKGDTALKQLMAATALTSCWIMWAIMFIAQLHPLVRPQLQGG